MRKGYICVAGIDCDTGRHVRPVLRVKSLSTAFLFRNGGPFDMTHIVDLGKTTHTGSPPEVEDYLFDPEMASRLGSLNPSDFWNLLYSAAKPTLLDIFGKDLIKRGSASCAVDVGKGKASLGCFVPKSRPKFIDRPDQIRVEVRDSEFGLLDLGVTDIRLFGKDHITPYPTVVKSVAMCFDEGVNVILSVGLTRPYSSSGNFPPVHWLQVNNIHLENNPAWVLG